MLQFSLLAAWLERMGTPPARACLRVLGALREPALQFLLRKLVHYAFLLYLALSLFYPYLLNQVVFWYWLAHVMYFELELTENYYYDYLYHVFHGLSWCGSLVVALIFTVVQLQINTAFTANFYPSGMTLTQRWVLNVVQNYLPIALHLFDMFLNIEEIKKRHNVEGFWGRSVARLLRMVWIFGGPLLLLLLLTQANVVREVYGIDHVTLPLALGCIGAALLSSAVFVLVVFENVKGSRHAPSTIEEQEQYRQYINIYADSDGEAVGDLERGGGSGANSGLILTANGTIAMAPGSAGNSTRTSDLSPLLLDSTQQAKATSVRSDSGGRTRSLRLRKHRYTHGQLLRALLTPGSLLPNEICTAAGPDAAEVLGSVVLVMESGGCCMQLICDRIDLEVQDASEAAELFHDHSTAGRLLQNYVNLLPMRFLSEFARSISTMPSYSVEIDPARLTADENLVRNRDDLVVLCKLFFETCLNCVPEVPISVRLIAAHLCERVRARFSPYATGNNTAVELPALGCFIFLHLFIRVLVYPKRFALVQHSPERPQRRALQLVGKTLFMLATDDRFDPNDGNQSFMVPLNSFLQENSARCQAFLRELATVPPEGAQRQERPIAIPDDVLNNAVASLRGFVERMD